MNIPNEIYEFFNMEKPEEKSDDKRVFIFNNDYKKKTLSTATKEDPIFFIVTEEKSSCHNNLIKDTLVACTGIKTVTFEERKYETYDEECAMLRILDGEYKGEGRTLPLKDITINIMKGHDEELHKLYNEIMDNIKCEITTKTYPDVEIIDEQLYDGSYPNIPVLYTKTYSPENVHTLDEADEWLIKNHPEEYIGYFSKNNIGDISFSCVPQAYSKGNEWMTREGREEIIKNIAIHHGYEVGEFDYSEIDEVMEFRRKEINDSLKQYGLKIINMEKDKEEEIDR